MLMRTNSKDYGEGRDPFEPFGQAIASFVADYVEIATEPLRAEIRTLRAEIRALQRKK